MEGLEKLNEELRCEYERTGRIDVLEKYVMSETIAPIEDYENVVKIIRENYCRATNSRLLMIGAHALSFWCHNEKGNDLLDILNRMQPFLSLKEQAMVSFLNAYHIRMRDANYKTNPKYEEYLLASLVDGVTFAENRVYLAELYEHDRKRRKRYLKEALSNIQKVLYTEDFNRMTLDDWLKPETFINAFILGTYIREAAYEELRDKLKTC